MSAALRSRPRYLRSNIDNSMNPSFLERKGESCPIQDEPEAGGRFQHKMSLKGAGLGMLGVDHQHGTGKADEPGADPGIHGSQSGDSIRGCESEGDLRLGEADFDRAAVSSARQSRERAAALLPGHDNGPEPGQGNEADRA